MTENKTGISLCSGDRHQLPVGISIVSKLEGALRQVRMHVREQAALQMTSMQSKEETRTALEGIADMIDNVLAYSARIAIEQAQHDKEMMK